VRFQFHRIQNNMIDACASAMCVSEPEGAAALLVVTLLNCPHVLLCFAPCIIFVLFYVYVCFPFYC
jgi:hypothetical protein